MTFAQQSLGSVAKRLPGASPALGVIRRRLASDEEIQAVAEQMTGKKMPQSEPESSG